MLTLLKSGFPHRHNDDGSHDSICLGCFATVATVQDEAQLSIHEIAHVCDAGFHYGFSQGSSLQVGRAS
jgi:hypothetical protein